MADPRLDPEPLSPLPAYDGTSAPPSQLEKSRSPRAPQPLRAPLPLEIPTLIALRGKRIGLTTLDIIPSTVPEAFPKSLAPFEYVLATSAQKATTVYENASTNPSDRGEPALVISADTIVVSAKGEILEKPRSEAHHISMLKTLRDEGRHRVFTAVTVMAPLQSAREPGYTVETEVEETTVRFDKDVSDDTLLAYVRTREGADKAGGYGIQGIGAILVERIEGSFDNVVGLPLRLTLKLIEKVLKQADDEDFDYGEDGLAE